MRHFTKSKKQLFEELECLYQGNIGELIKYRDLC